MLYKIYRIYFKGEKGKEYIGYTRQKELRFCLKDHKRKSGKGEYNGKNGKLYKAISEKGKKNFDIELIEKIEIEDRDELKLRINKEIENRKSRLEGYNK